MGVIISNNVPKDEVELIKSLILRDFVPLDFRFLRLINSKNDHIIISRGIHSNMADPVHHFNIRISESPRLGGFNIPGNSELHVHVFLDNFGNLFVSDVSLAFN